MIRFFRLIRTLLSWAMRSPEWRRPQQAEILVFDAEMSELLTEFFGGHSYRILHQRSSNLNLPILIRAVRRGFSLDSYLTEYALAVNPRIVVSMLDNETSLYRLKSVLPNARIIAIQNGWRGVTYDIFGISSTTDSTPLEADDILVFGPAIGTKFESLIHTRTTPIGSFKSNLIPINKDRESRAIALVSTIRQKVDLDRQVPVGNGFSNVSYREIFERRLELARLVHQFARQEGFHLRILGKDDQLGREFDMYRHHLGDLDESWSFTPRLSLLANYSEVDRARAVVSSSSTLGYEALGRGVRSAFFMIDFEVLRDEGTRFGWPLDLPEDGPFWTHSLDASKIEQVLNNVVVSNDDEWQQISCDVAAQLITFDANNTRFAEMLKSN